MFLILCAVEINLYIKEGDFLDHYYHFEKEKRKWE